MVKETIILLLTLTLFGCKKKPELPINESQFQNKTFSIFSEFVNDTLVIEFQDSTYQIFDNSSQGKIPWRISHYDNTNFLILDNNVIGIRKIDKGRFNCTYIGLMENDFIISERKPKWSKELIYGTWIKKEDERNFKFSMNDSIQKTPPPPAPDGFFEKDFKRFKYYEISKDSITYSEDYSIEMSYLEINNTNEYLLMELGEEEDYEGEKNRRWDIQSLSDKTLIVERNITKSYEINYVIDTLIRIKL